jgi:TRAP-type C4-dicarboxylate transport system permease small subunit
MFQKKLFSCMQKITAMLNGVAGLVIFLMMLLTVGNVLLRKLVGINITGTVEASEFMMIVLVFFALAQAEVMNRNVSVSLLMDRLKLGTQRHIATFTHFANALLYALITAAAIYYASSLKDSSEVSMDLQIPKYPFVYIIAAGAAVLSFVFLKKSLVSIKDKKPLWIP